MHGKIKILIMSEALPQQVSNRKELSFLFLLRILFLFIPMQVFFPLCFSQSFPVLLILFPLTVESILRHFYFQQLPNSLNFLSINPARTYEYLNNLVFPSRKYLPGERFLKTPRDTTAVPLALQAGIIR